MSDQKLIIGYYRLSMEDDSEGESNKKDLKDNYKLDIIGTKDIKEALKKALNN